MELVPDHVRNVLNEGEKIAWIGYPDPKSVAIRRIPESLFSFLFFGMAVKAFLTAFNPYGGKLHIEPDTEVGLQIAVIAFFAFIGIAIFLLPFFSYKDAQKTTYCVSNQRVMQIVAKKKTSVQSRSYTQLTPLKRKEKKNGINNYIKSFTRT